jgi:hypothetical protein
MCVCVCVHCNFSTSWLISMKLGMCAMQLQESPNAFLIPNNDSEQYGECINL